MSPTATGLTAHPAEMRFFVLIASRARVVAVSSADNGGDTVLEALVLRRSCSALETGPCSVTLLRRPGNEGVVRDLLEGDPCEDADRGRDHHDP